MVEVLPSITELRIDEIEVGTGRLREVSKATVDGLVFLIQETDFIAPIAVRKNKTRFELIDGAHRLEAMRRLGRETIPVRAVRCTKVEALQMETGGNLAAAGMTPVDDAVFLAAWKRAYEERHPEAKAGQAGATARWDMQRTYMSFASVIAAKRSTTERHVRRIVQVGEALSRDEVRWLRSAPRKVRLVDLMQIAKIGEDAERAKVCIALANGEAKSAADARAKYRAERGEGAKPTDPIEFACRALQNAFERAPMAARRRFIEANLDALLPLMREADIAQFTDLAAALTEALEGAPKE